MHREFGKLLVFVKIDLQYPGYAAQTFTCVVADILPFPGLRMVRYLTIRSVLFRAGG